MTHEEMTSRTFEMHQSLKFRRVGKTLCLSLRMLVVAVSIFSLSGCLGYVPGRQSYWDDNVAEMCRKDGGVHILARVSLTQEQFERLPKVGTLTGVRQKSLAGKSDPLYYEQGETVLREANPQVVRMERLVKVPGSGLTVARIVSYLRIGGDMPSLAHRSGFGCPDDMAILRGLQDLYEVQGGSK